MLAWLALSAVRKVFRSVPGARKDFWGGAPPGPWNLQSLLTDFVAGACAASKLSGESTQPDPSVQGPPVGCGWGIEPQVSCAGGGGAPNPLPGSHRALQRTQQRVQLPRRPRAVSPKPSAEGTNSQFSKLGDSVGSRGAGGGGGRGGVCRNERGRSRLLETNFTNDFCNN